MERYQYTPAERAALEGLRQPLAVYQFLDRRVVTLILSDGFCKLFGYEDRAEALHDMDHNMYKDTHPDDVARISDAAFRFATEGGRYEVVYRTRKKGSADYRLIHATGEHVWTAGGTRLAQVWYTDEGDDTEDPGATAGGLSRSLSNALHEQSLVRASQFDELTGLPSMSYFFELADAGKQAMLEQYIRPCLLYLDLQGMKFFNSRHGFAEGDRMLRALAKLLIGAFGAECCCRIGADHFVVYTGEEGVEDRLRDIFEAFGALYEGQTPPIHVGIYVSRLEAIPASSACDRAKLACGQLRGSYGSAFRYYTQELQEKALRRQYIVEAFDTALRERWIQVYYQPIIRSVTERVCDEEALARWIDPERGFLSPADFIPILEDAGLIYRMDLYMLDRVLEHIQLRQAEGMYIVPHSLNLSRSDFDACDIVEEIRARVDKAGVPRDRITIEITESMIGRDLDFMREQVNRFRALGFPVWMDDFGSGYSSLDLLQSIRFDLLKFDMSFLRKLDEGEDGKTILTELMKMAASLGLDTVCEGVETREQKQFLKEIGCAKQQGFYFSKPNPFQRVLDWHRSHQLDSYEDPAEAAYYDAISRVNLYDLRVLAQGEESGPIQNAFDTLPMGIIEIRGDAARFARSNQSYRDFIRRVYGVELTELGTDFSKFDAPFLQNIVNTCREPGSRSFYEERMPDGSKVRSFSRRIADNPVRGGTAVAVAVLSVTEPQEGESYEDIARALAADYRRIYVVDLDTDRYIEYLSPPGREELAVERRGEDFFETARRTTMTRLYEQDRELFLRRFTKENILRELDSQGMSTNTYRLMQSGKPVYVNMKVSRMHPQGNRIILGISNVDAYMKQKERFEALRQERDSMARIMALSDGYMSLFTVNRDGSYTEYSSSDDFDRLGVAKQGVNFFAQARADAQMYFPPEDAARFAREFRGDKVLEEIRRSGSYRIHYRLMIDGVPKPVVLKAALFQEGSEEKMVVGIRACSGCVLDREQGQAPCTP